uniref:ULP_PROTEASE domain-containing protein n=1 Tax=Bursaphelenchus xylophilus TaxID=6326 RepID=A0A1I7RP24_BURXY
MVKKTKHIRQGRASESTDNQKVEEVTPWVENGSCPVPMVMCCNKGEPVGETDGVRMFCSSKDCTINNVLHKQCFEELEIGLIKILQNKGSARRWTEDQRMSNLWTKKGMNILARFLRCKCSKGILDKREDFRMPEKPTVVEVFPKAEHIHAPKIKKRELPSLNTGPRSTVTARNAASSRRLGKFNPHFMDCHSDEEDLPTLRSSLPSSPATIAKPKPLKSLIQKEKIKLNYLSKVKDAKPAVSPPPNPDWPSLEGEDEKSSPVRQPQTPPKELARPRKTFSEVTQQCKPKVTKKPPEDNVYKVLSRKDLEIRRLPGCRKPSEPRNSESERSMTSRRTSESTSEIGRGKEDVKDLEKNDDSASSVGGTREDKVKPLQIRTELYHTGPIPGLAHELMAASPVDVCRSTPSIVFHNSRPPSSLSFSEKSSATFESDENVKPPPVSIAETFKSIRLRSALTSQFLDLDKYDFGPKYKTNEAFIQSLIRDATDFFQPPPFLDELGFNPALWSPI